MQKSVSNKEIKITWSGMLTNLAIAVVLACLRVFA